MQLMVRPEPVVDYEETARLATEAFGSPAVSFSASKLRWLYDISFSHGTTVLSTYAEERKVGQVALLHQDVQVDGRHERAVALVDLFILKEFRSGSAVADLYAQVRAVCEREGIRFILAVPNPVSTKINMRYLKMKPALTLAIRAGVALPWRSRAVTTSQRFDTLAPREAAALFARYARGDDAGLAWTGDGLWARFQDASHTYGVHATADVLMVSSPRSARGVPHTLICAILVRPGAIDPSADVRALVRAACLMHRRPAFAYAGHNAHLPTLPGRAVPERYRPSPMVLQMRDFAPERGAVALDRFELLDFDYA